MAGALFIKPVSAINLDDASSIMGGNNKGINEAVNYTGGNAVKTAPEIVASVIKVAMGFFATVLLIMIIVAGVKIMVSKGDTGSYTKARGLLTKSIVGMVIVALAYVISDFGINAINTVVNESGETGGRTCQSHNDCETGEYCCLPNYINCREHYCETITTRTYCGTPDDENYTGRCGKYDPDSRKQIIGSTICDHNEERSAEWQCYAK